MESGRCQSEDPRDGQTFVRVMVKRLLKKYGYPPDMEQLATETVLKQAEMMAAEMV